LVFLGCLLAWMLLVPGSWISENRAEKPKELTKDERDQLQRRALELQQQVFQLYQQGKFLEATKIQKQVLDFLRRLYPEATYPQGHRDLAISLNNLASLLQAQGEYAKALDYYRQALEMRQRLYPKAKYPQGHPDLAQSLNNLGFVLQAQGKYAKALGYFRQALEMRQRLYPKDQYPQGHPLLATSLNNLGSLSNDKGEYAEALAYYRQALEMKQRLYPKAKYPDGHSSLATSLINLGTLLQDQGEYGKALGYYRQALEMDQRLYPKEKYPQGHPDLAMDLINLASLLQDQGEYAQALGYSRQALDMCQRLYPKDKYPQGHPLLATSLSNLGSLFKHQREYGKALGYSRQALEMYQRLYPKDKYPHGHPDVAASLDSLGGLLQEQGEYGKALGYYRHGLEMFQRLYPKDKFPQGHPHLGLSLNNLGRLLKARGEYAKALDYMRQALEMLQRLYPKATYPHGHPHLAASLDSLGDLLQAQGQFAKALGYLREALEMRHDLADHLLSNASEANASSYAASLPRTRDGLLSAFRHLPSTDASTYDHVWRSKAALTRLLERRHRALRLAASDTKDPTRAKQIRTLERDLLATRQQLARLLLRPSQDAKAHAKRLQQLSAAKEELEEQLAKLAPAFAREQALKRLGPADLVKHLPAGTAFIDLLHYVRFDQDPKVAGKKGEKRTLCYVAFVLCPGRPVRRVELGSAEPIESAVRTWRGQIRDKEGGDAGARLRRRVWEPLCKHLPAGTQTVFLALDGDLTRLPWAALPGQKKGTVLLEDYALAVVPHGPFLLDRLTAEADKDQKNDFLLAVGGVRYDAKPETADATPTLAYARSAVRGEAKLVWDHLPGTLTELKQVVARAGERSVQQWSGAKASTARLLADLPQARWAHLATHGFFADQKFRSFLQLDEKLYDRRGFWEGPPPGARNPLVLSGLVLAGANVPPKKGDPLDEGDGGILTAEVIAGLPLHRLELVVLSACETGLGRVAGGEGVFGLQRAFHLAGAKSVVASLWKVDDQATAALMVLFYDKLWREKKTALVALREAQLTLYHHPERIKDLAKERGPKLDKIVPLPIERSKEAKARGAKAPPKLWAGFVLSGIGK
jgi:CHAT domain-containing protein/Tfp pilus assembly protein PilF